MNNHGFFTQNNIHVLPRPSEIPDLKPIEHLWDKPARRVNQSEPSPQSFDSIHTKKMQSVLLGEETKVPEENNRPVASH
jgi:transposase